jgi:hypothetical protein
MNHTEFFQSLADARQLASRRLSTLPGDGVVEAVAEQLDAMHEWTQDDRAPTAEEKNRVCVDVIAIREFDGHPDQELREFGEALCILNYHFANW